MLIIAAVMPVTPRWLFSRFPAHIGHTAETRKRVQIALAVLLPTLAGVIAWLVWREREPVYQGKSLSLWLQDCDKSWWVGTERRLGQEAVRQIGTNAIPALLRRLRRKDSSLTLKVLTLAKKQHFIRIWHTPAAAYNHKGAVGFEALGQTAKDAVPALIQIFKEDISADSQSETAIALGWIGPAAKQALPTLIEASTNANYTARAQAVWALTRIGGEADRLVPVFITCAGNPWYGYRQLALPGLHGSVQAEVVLAIGGFGTAAKNAVPTVVHLLDDLDDQARQAATNALKQIDPEAAARTGVR